MLNERLLAPRDGARAHARFDWRRREVRVWASSAAAAARAEEGVRALHEALLTALTPDDEPSGACCAVCAEAVAPGRATVALGCGHVYCVGCLCDWLREASAASDGERFAPRCRRAGCAHLVGASELKAALSGERMAAVARAALAARAFADRPLRGPLRLCPSLACDGVLLAAPAGARACACSACGARACTACESEEHEGLNCAQAADARRGAADLRARAIDEALTERCPRCACALRDFDGSFAMRCAECAAAVCGWCLAECADDAHAHVASCSEAPRPPSGGARPSPCLGTWAEFAAAQRRRQLRRLDAFARALPAAADGARGAEEQGALDELAVQLRALELGVDSPAARSL